MKLPFRSASRSALVALLAVALVPVTVVAQQPTAGVPAPDGASAQPASAASQPFLPLTPEDARLGPQDAIVVTIVDAPELTRTYTITADGTFTMPYLGVIDAQGKTPEEVAVVVADGLRDRYLKNPLVTVSVQQYFTPVYFIQGAVRSPGLHRIRGRVSLLKLLATAGGLADDHGTLAYVIREEDPVETDRSGELIASAATPPAPGAAKAAAEDAERYSVQEINIAGMLKGNLATNVSVQPGDMVSVPAADTFYVAGEVNAPGPFSLKQGTTLRQAISLAQGVKFEGSKGNTVIFRENPMTGKREEIRVDLGDIMNGKKEDVAILANDIIIVPNSRAKAIGNTILGIFGGAVMRGRGGVIPRR